MTDRSSEDPLIWSPLAFLRAFADPLRAHAAEEAGALAIDTGVMVVTAGDGSTIAARELAWDSQWFGCPIVRVEHASVGSDGPRGLAGLLRTATNDLAARAGEGPWQLFLEVPADASAVVQAAGLAGMRLVETRVTYVVEDLRRSGSVDGAVTRFATPDDGPALREVAERARNPWDRYHADPFYPADVADAYLGEYAARSVLGLADSVIVPDDPPGSAPGGFMTLQVSRPPQCPTGRDHACDLALGVGRIRLVAVAPERQGWHRRLLAASTRWFRDQGLDVATMTTQLSNRAVTRNSEALGYRLGRATHLMVASSGHAPGQGRSA